MDFFKSENIELKRTTMPIQRPENFLFSRSHFTVSEADFFLDVANVARYYVKDGSQITVNPYEDSDEESINLFLEGSVLGALLHQRQILPLHGSSFTYKNKGIIICGNSGVGKSSLTTAFVQNGATFINDDVTPIVLKPNKEAIILPVKTRIKLWSESLKELTINSDNLSRVRPAMDKFYLSVDKSDNKEFPINYIFILGTHNKEEMVATELRGMEKYNTIRQHIYRKIYLKGMPGTEKKYFANLLSMSGRVKIIRIIRPSKCEISKTMQFIEKQINE